jgi:hypothetical protein
MLTATGEAVQTSAGDLHVVTVDGRKGGFFGELPAAQCLPSLMEKNRNSGTSAAIHLSTPLQLL